MIVFPNAKINLGLNITEKRADGYHNLETIFYPIPLEDALEIHESGGSQSKFILHQSGMAIAGNPEENLVMKACRLLDNEFGLPSLDIYLHKHIPSGAGLGGGSADAAFMLKLLNERFSLGLSRTRLEELAGMLGADCAFFIRNTPVYAEGIGNVFTPVALSLKGYRILLVKPAVSVSTREAFSLITPHRPENSLKETIGLPVSKWKDRMVNDFEAGVFLRFPIIAEIKDAMYKHGAIYAAMSGSGSSVFGLFPHRSALPEIDFGNDAFVFRGKPE